MNPIKTPREMLFEMLGVPSMAAGGAYNLAGQVAKAVAAFKRMYGKEPSPEDIKALEAYAQNLSQPTSGLRTGQSAAPRAQYELATNRRSSPPGSMATAANALASPSLIISSMASRISSAVSLFGLASCRRTTFLSSLIRTAPARTGPG